MSREVDFIEKIAGMVKSHDSVMFSSVRIAQACLESGYGTSDLALRAHNLFGIKASNPWVGRVYNKVSGEVINGQSVNVASDFRVYNSWDESIKDHASFITSTDSRRVIYKDVISAKNPEVQARALSGTYATDPKYGEKLINIIKKYDLQKYDFNTTQKKGGEVVSTVLKPKINDRTKEAMGAGTYGYFGWRPLSQIQYIVWHYTAVPRSYNRFISQHEGYWRDTHGWDIGGYHFYIDARGEIWQNYSLHVSTYGVAGFNPNCVHISVEANSKNDYSKAQLQARESLTLWLMRELGIGANKLAGHKEFKGHESNGCPGYSVRELGEFRAKYTKLLAGQTLAKVQDSRDVKIPQYTSPTHPFDALKVGQTVEIRDGFSFWYNPNNVSIGVKPSKNFVGATDVIKAVRDCNIGYSKKAYLLNGYNSWILEQDLVEARASWVKKSDEASKIKDEEVVKVEEKETSKIEEPKPTDSKKTDVPVIKEDNYLYFEGKYYKIGSEI